jgi:hypothetical protein
MDAIPVSILTTDVKCKIVRPGLPKFAGMPFEREFYVKLVASRIPHRFWWLEAVTKSRFA